MPETSPNLSRHGVRLTESLRDVLGDETVEPRAVGYVLRKMREGLTQSTLSIAGDPSIDNEEKGRTVAVIAMISEAFAAAYDRPGPTPAAKMPPLTSR
jgi:hypothetical protein